MDKQSKEMERPSFFIALKLIALKQNGKLLNDCIEECLHGKFYIKSQNNLYRYLRGRLKLKSQ
jgi:hypothetical protein